jgi:amidase
LKHLRPKKFYVVLDRRNEPVLKVKPGETFVVETQDNVSGTIKTEKDLVTSLRFEDLNPVSGPIYVNDAEKGDTLTVRIEEIKIPEQGWTGFRPEWLYWETRGVREVPPIMTKICKISNGMISFPLKSGTVFIPAKPIIGTIGTAPEAEAALAVGGGKHGGNMDSVDVCPGNTVFLPVFVKGALLYLGDVHAAQGDGELNGAPVEVPAECTLTLNLVKGKTITWPRIDTPDSIVTVGLGKPLDEALKNATAEMVEWLTSDYGFDRWDASILLASIADAKVCAVANADYVMAVKFPKKYLPARNFLQRALET